MTLSHESELGGLLRTSDGGRTWRLRRGTLFVAQWRGAPGVRSAGTVPLRVRLSRR